MEDIEVLDKNPNEIVLTNGKKVKLRELKGQHHIVESRLLSVCSENASNDGVNIGDLILASDIKLAIAIEEIDGKRIKIPKKLSEVMELANEFSYDDWSELKLAIQPKKELIEATAKNLQKNSGLENE